MAKLIQNKIKKIEDLITSHAKLLPRYAAVRIL